MKATEDVLLGRCVCICSSGRLAVQKSAMLYVRLDKYLFRHISGTFKSLLVVAEAVSQ